MTNIDGILRRHGVAVGCSPRAGGRHRGRGLHRIARRRRSRRARGRGRDRRQPRHGQARERPGGGRAPRRRHPRAARRPLRRAPARGRLPPRRAGRPARGGGAPARGRGHQRARDDPRARGGPPPRRAGRLQLHRRRDLRRVRRAPRRRARRSNRSRRTARRSSPGRSTCGRTTGCTDARHVALRYGNVYGPRQDPHGEAGVVAIFLGALAAGEQAKIFGEGAQTRDYVYVGDVARATVSAVGPEGGVFNIGTGREVSVNELYELCRETAGSSTEAEHVPARLGELQRSVLDPGARRDPARLHGDGRARGRAGRDLGLGAEGVAARPRESDSRVDHPLVAPDALVRPWRLAAFVAGAIAAVELLILLAIGGGALVGARLGTRPGRGEEGGARPGDRARGRSPSRRSPRRSRRPSGRARRPP